MASQSGASQSTTLGANGELESLGLAVGEGGEVLGEALALTVGLGAELGLSGGVDDAVGDELGLSDGTGVTCGDTAELGEPLGDGLGLALGGSTTSRHIASWLFCELPLDGLAVRVKVPWSLPSVALVGADSSKASCSVWPAFRVRPEVWMPALPSQKPTCLTRVVAAPETPKVKVRVPLLLEVRFSTPE